MDEKHGNSLFWESPAEFYYFTEIKSDYYPTTFVGFQQLTCSYLDKKKSTINFRTLENFAVIILK